MSILPFTPRLNSFKASVADDVITAEFSNLPISQRVDTHKPYDVAVSFLLNGTDHDALLAFYRANTTKYVQVKLTLADSELKYYDCLIADAPSITPITSARNFWQPEDINEGIQNTDFCYFESQWQLLAIVPHRVDADLAIVDRYNKSHNGKFAGYILAIDGS